jgi:outer membrane protein, heavy metal efflux system
MTFFYFQVPDGCRPLFFTSFSYCRLIVAMVLLFSISACAHYQPQPLTEKTIQQQLQMPTSDQLSIQVAKIKHPLLEPVKINIQDGLSPDEAAILAIVGNPELRAVRDQYAIANAQLLQAGLLPNPQLSYIFAAPSGGTDLGMNNAFGISIDWQVTALIWHASKINAAEKQQQNIVLQIAWQEWQIAQAAKLAAYQLIVYKRQQALLTEMALRLEKNRARMQQAADEGLVTELDRVAAISAKNLVGIRLLALEQQQQQQQQRLNRAMGLKPNESVLLQKHINLASNMKTPVYDDLIDGLEYRRLDLLALQRGYESQEEHVHIAVLQQFPQISIGFNHALDNSNLYTLGFGVSMTLPIFDQNQAQIALERATRQQLFDQYANRMFITKANIAELLVTISSLNEQIKSVREAIPGLANLVKAYRFAIDYGQVDVLNYYVAWNTLTDKRIDLLALKLQLVQAGIALEVASGRYQL